MHILSHNLLIKYLIYNIYEYIELNKKKQKETLQKSDPNHAQNEDTENN